MLAHNNQIFMNDFVCIHYHLRKISPQIIECKIFGSILTLYNTIYILYNWITREFSHTKFFKCKEHWLQIQLLGWSVDNNNGLMLGAWYTKGVSLAPALCQGCSLASAQYCPMLHLSYCNRCCNPDVASLRCHRNRHISCCSAGASRGTTATGLGSTWTSGQRAALVIHVTCLNMKCDAFT